MGKPIETQSFNLLTLQSQDEWKKIKIKTTHLRVRERMMSGSVLPQNKLQKEEKH